MIGTKPETRAGPFAYNLGPRARYCGKQPVQAAFAGDELDFPVAILADQFVVPFRDTQDFVYWLDPFSGHALFSEHGREGLSQPNLEAASFPEKRFGSLRVNLGKAEQLGTSFGRDDAGRVQKMYETFPGEFAVWGNGIDKIDGKPSTKQRKMRRGSWHIGKPRLLTGKGYHNG